MRKTANIVAGALLAVSIPVMVQIGAAQAPCARVNAQQGIAVFSTEGVFPFTPRYEFKEGRPYTNAARPADLKEGKNIVWSDDLIGNIHGQMLYLKNKAPGMLKLACVRAPIQIFYYDKIELGGQEIFGYPYQGNIMLSRAFFAASPTEQQHFMTNMVVAAADVDGVISYNPAWVTMARPHLTVGNAKYSPAGGSEYWPRYGEKALSESLNNYITDYIEGKKYPDRSQFEQSVAPSVFTPDSDELEWCQLMYHAREKIRAGAYDDAVLKLNRAGQLMPEEPMSYYWLAAASAYGGNLANTLSHVQVFTDKMAALNLPKDDTAETDSLQNLVQIFIDKKQYQDADTFLEPLCTKYPNIKWFAIKRDLCKAPPRH